MRLNPRSTVGVQASESDLKQYLARYAMHRWTLPMDCNRRRAVGGRGQVIKTVSLFVHAGLSSRTGGGESEGEMLWSS